MAFNQPCPKCRYQRKTSDPGPDWQCPACGIAYAKAMGVNQSLKTSGRHTYEIKNQFQKRNTLDWLLTGFIILSFLILIGSWLSTKQLPLSNDIVSEMLNEPVQTPTREKPFDFYYRKKQYLVKPVANYELWGVVVTHNNITGMTDITHTEDSVDLKDLCVVWGDNIKANHYREVSYSSGDFTCFFSYQRPLQFNHSQLSNNHLLSDNKQVRDLIRGTNIGDQIYLKGMLVNYAPASNPQWVRRSSTIRNDAGKRACEVVFVNDFEIIKSSNDTAHWIFSLSIWSLIISLLLKLASIAFPNLFQFGRN